MQPKISFVIPYFDKLHTIKKCVKSLKEQSVKDIEIIVVLDGPDKEALKILNKIQGIKIIELPENKGAPAARNAGLDAARGEYISFWDADSFIEPGAAAVWLQIFDKNPETDFVYAGYMFEEGQGGIPGRPFDEYLLEVNNYISGHFPIKRAKCPRWDEGLKSLQDWDFWLQAVRNGCKGQYIRGYAFRTKLPDPSSISGKGCTPDVWLERLETVKKKHGIPLRDVCVTSLKLEPLGVSMAKILQADYRDNPGSHPHRYKTLIQIGFSAALADHHARAFASPKDVRKILFWTGADVQELYQAPFIAVQGLAAILNNTVHLQLCEDKVCADSLKSFGFKNVQYMPLPLDTKDLKVNPLPKTLRVLVDVAHEYRDFFESIARALPDVELHRFDEKVTNIDAFSALIYFKPDRSLSATLKQTILAGRRVISNVQGLYTGFRDDQQDMEVIRKELISDIRALRDFKKPDYKASETYQALYSEEKFKESFSEVLNPKEAVAI